MKSFLVHSCTPSNFCSSAQRFAALIAIVLAFSVQAQSADFVWLNKTIVGTDSFTGQQCVMTTPRSIDESLLGDKIQVEVALGEAPATSYTLINHPFFKGSSYGATLYVRSQPTDTYWAQVDIVASQRKVIFTYSHLTSRKDGSPLDWPGQGEFTRCEGTVEN